jgi:alpha-tubulin suppressor-like RCC1 family protein
MRSKRMATRIAALVLALVIGSSAPGYVFILDDSGCVSTWREGTIPILVKLNNSQLLTDGTTRAQSVLAAMQEWNVHLGTVQFVGTAAAPGAYGIWDGTSEIVMDSAINSDGESFPFGEFTLAVTISFDDGNTISESDIVFNTAFQWDSFRGGQNGSEHDIRRVAAHELGHVLGLDHPDEATPPQYGWFLMNSLVSYSPSINAPQADDIAGAQVLYGYPGFVPPNDDFDHATAINMLETDAVLHGTNVAATKETGEPDLDVDDPGGRTVWWKWTATYGGSLTVTTLGSNFDTLLGAYTGATINALTQLALNDDVESGVIRSSTVTINVDYGTTYYFAVDGWNGVVGTVRLNLNVAVDSARSPPRFWSPPKSLVRTAGQSFSYWAGVLDPVGINFVWKRNGQPIPGQTKSSLELVSIGLEDRGHYEVVASNPTGSATSRFDFEVITPDLGLVVVGDNTSGQTTLPTSLDEFITADAGGDHVVALNSNGAAIMWGSNSAGQTSHPGSNGLVFVAAGASHNLALRDDGTLVAWGGTPHILQSWTQAWHVPPGIGPVIAIGAGRDTNIALQTNGTVVSWGSETGVTPPNGLNDVIAVAAGAKHFLALKADRTVVGWGLATSGESTPPVGLADVVAIAAGGDAQGGHSLALKQDGTVVAWGNNTWGQATVPADLSNVVSIAAGGAFSLALKSDGSIVGWGDNRDGQLSIPADLGLPFRLSAGAKFSAIVVRSVLPEITTQPVDVTLNEGGTAQFSVAARGTPVLKYQWKRFGAALVDGGRISGAQSPNLQISEVQQEDSGGYSAAVTNRSGTVSTSPVQLNVVTPSSINLRPPSSQVLEGQPASFTVGAGSGGPFTYQWRHNRKPIPGATGATLNLASAGVSDAGYYEAFVTNGAGGVSSTVFYLSVASANVAIVEWGDKPEYTPSISGPISSIGVGGASFALKGDGTVVAWGLNNTGQANVPAGLANVVSVTAGPVSTFALKADGTVAAWGDNSYSQTALPAGLSDVVATSAEYAHAIALRSNGTVVTWGTPSESSVSSLLNVPAGLKGVVGVQAVDYGYLALLSSGQVVGWGTYSFSSQPPAGLTDVVSLSARGSRVVALKGDGTTVEWGSSYWALPDPGLSGVVSIAVGSNHALALLGDGTVAAWGSNDRQQTNLPPGLGGVVAIAAGGNSGMALSRIGPPVFTRQPESISAVLGDRVLISASVSGSLPMFFQWRRNGEQLTDGPGLTGSRTLTLELDPVDESSTGTYDLLITNNHGNVVSAPAVLTIRVPPRFTKRPLSKLAGVGSSVTFSAEVSDPGPVTYQWKHNGEPIAGANSPLLTIPSVAYSHAGFYEVTATNSVAGNWSVFALKVSPVPTHDLALAEWGQSDNGLIGPAQIPSGLGTVIDTAIGYSHAIALRADGTVKTWGTGYWEENNETAAGLGEVVAVAATYYQAFALRADGTVVQIVHSYQNYNPVPIGLRRVVSIAADAYGALLLSSDGTVVSLGLEEPPANLNNVVAIDVGFRGAVALKRDRTVVAWGPWSVDYVVTPPGLSDVTAVAAGDYHALALKSNGSVVAWGSTFDGATAVPSDLGPVVAIGAGRGHSVVLKPDGSAVAWGNKAYNTNVATGTRPDLVPIAAISAGGHLNLVLTGTKVAPTISLQPVGGTFPAGSYISLRGTAAGRPAPFIQWQKNGANIPDATSEYLSLQNPMPEDSGTYRLMATNSVGTAISNEVQVIVQHQVGYPVILPAGRPLVVGETMTMSSATTGAKIIYTTDGSAPSRQNGLTYSGPITVSSSFTLRAFAYMDGMMDSQEVYREVPVSANSVPIASFSHVPTGIVGSQFYAILASLGGNGDPVWSIESGSLPAGLGLTVSGAIIGIPTDAGTAILTLKLADNDSFTGPFDEDTLQLAITVDAIDEVPSITTASLPDAGLSITYAAQLAGSGGNGSLKWSLASGSLPPGLTLSESGTISGIPQALGTRTFTVRAGDDDTISGASDEATKELSITVVPSPRLTNVSMRAFAGAGEDTLIVGFYIAGSGQKTVLIRGVGPKLRDYNVPSVVADPRITLYKDQTILDSNNDWDASLGPVFPNAGAFALDVGSKDAAMTATLAPGGYTIHLVNNGPVAEALVEVYDISRDAGTRLVNVSSRLRFRPGQLAILGTAVTGGPIPVLTRNVGPGLAKHLINPLEALPDPHLRLYVGQAEVAANDDWDAALLPFFASSGAFTIDEGSKDAAIRAEFQIGGYTVHSTANGGEGVALIEIYESP